MIDSDLTEEPQFLKTDVLGRIRTTRDQREAILQNHAGHTIAVAGCDPCKIKDLTAEKGREGWRRFLGRGRMGVVTKASWWKDLASLWSVGVQSGRSVTVPASMAITQHS